MTEDQKRMRAWLLAEFAGQTHHDEQALNPLFRASFEEAQGLAIEIGYGRDPDDKVSETFPAEVAEMSEDDFRAAVKPLAGRLVVKCSGGRVKP